MVALLVLMLAVAPGFQSVRILATADLHGRLHPSSDFEAPGSPRRLLGGWANLSHQVGKWSQPGCLLLDCGDFALGGPESDSSYGRLTIELMNRLGYDAVTVGARDFTGGAGNLEMLAKLAAFPVLADPMLDVALNRQAPLFRPWVVTDLGDLRAAIVGLSDPSSARVNHPANTRGFEPDPLSAQLRRYLPLVRADAPDVIIALGHVEPSAGAGLLDSFPDLDLVICPEAKNRPPVVRDGLVQVAAYGQRLAVVDMLVQLGERRVDAVQTRQVNVLPVPEPDSALAAGLASVRLDGLDTAVVGVPVEFTPDEEGLVALGSTVAEVVRVATGSAVAVLPVEVVESGIPEGLVTLRDLYRVAPFRDRLRTCTMNDTTLHKLLAGVDDADLAPFLGGADYFVLGDTVRWPLAVHVARVRLRASRPPVRVVTTEALLERAGMAGTGKLLAETLTELWTSNVAAREDLGPVARPTLYPAAAGLVPARREPAGPVNINTADVTSLQRLPGIGPKTAQRIVAYRDEHGRFDSVDGLQNVRGIGPKTVAKLRPLAVVR